MSTFSKPRTKGSTTLLYKGIIYPAKFPLLRKCLGINKIIFKDKWEHCRLNYKLKIKTSEKKSQFNYMNSPGGIDQSNV